MMTVCHHTNRMGGKNSDGEEGEEEKFYDP